MTDALVLDQKQRIADWVADRVGMEASWGSYYAMGVERKGAIIAGVVFNNFNGANATAHIAITVKTRRLLDLFKAVADYAFRQCKLLRLTGLVPANKPEVMAFDKHLGFEEEAVLKHAATDGADVHVLVLWPDKCRWLEKTHAIENP